MLAQADCPRWLRIARSLWAYLILAAIPGALAVHEILNANGGTPAVPLDDSYIHFQFARSFATGHPFVYSPGAAPVPGATSLLWPLLLAIPQLLGVQGESIIPWAWAFGFAALGLLAYETARAAEGLCDPRLAWLAGVLVLSFSAHTWFAASGMEVVPLAWLLMRSARRAADWAEGDRRRLGELLLLALLTPLMRPEGALGSLLIATALGVSPSRQRVFALMALACVGVPPLVYFAFTGHATQTTTLVKWLPFSPYLSGSGLLAVVSANVSLFFSTLLDGKQWSAAFIPEHSKFVAWLALPALIVAGQLRMRNARAWLLVALAFGILLPTTYDSFLWNRLRYLWPFAAPWLLGLTVLADQLGELAGLLWRRLSALGYGVSALLIAALLSTFPFALYDLGVSARAISLQQVSLGKWAKDTLDPRARIGVNDTGAIGYFSERAVFDVVGLTTLGEARYWSSGPGSRFEHYERLPRSALPTHFIVYPGWFAIPDLLGMCLAERTVNASILGGTTMVACVADYSKLGSGERPSLLADWQREPVDTLDVADLESERSHDYAIFSGVQADNLVLSNGVVVDGARRNRQNDSFRLQLVPGGRLVARLGADTPVTVSLRCDGQMITSWTVSRPDFEDHSLRLPRNLKGGSARVEVTAGSGSFSSAHYWSYDAAE